MVGRRYSSRPDHFDLIYSKRLRQAPCGRFERRFYYSPPQAQHPNLGEKRLREGLAIVRPNGRPPLR
jgi:hypothetical protein